MNQKAVIIPLLARCFLFLLFCITAIDTAAQSAGNEPIYLKYADSLIGRADMNGTVRELNGRVNLTQGDVIVYCNRAIQYLDLNKVELIGAVKIIQGTITLTAPRADYDGNQRIAWGYNGVKITDRETILDADSGRYSTAFAVANFTGNVHILDDSVRIAADSIEYSRRTKNSTAIGHVIVRGKHTNTVIAGDSAWNIPSIRYSRIVGNAILRQIDTVSSTTDSVALPTAEQSQIPIDSARASLRFDTLTISARQMEAFRQNGEEYIASGTTEIMRSALAARADTIIYEKDKDILRLRGTKPAIWYDSTQIRADSLTVYLPNKKLRLIEAAGNAFSATRDDTTHSDRIQQLVGSYIRIYIENDTLKKIFARGDTKSLYFMLSDGEPDGAARNLSDSILIESLNGRPETIRWLSGVHGEYFPEQFVHGKSSDFYLPNFIWLANRPKKKTIGQ